MRGRRLRRPFFEASGARPRDALNRRPARAEPGTQRRSTTRQKILSPAERREDGKGIPVAVGAADYDRRAAKRESTSFAQSIISAADKGLAPPEHFSSNF
jgi:hypothetical protein